MNSLRPGDFPLGSTLSRAAARLLMKERRDTRKRVTLISNVCRSGGDENEPHVGPWRDFGDTLMRMIYLPNVWLKPGQAIPSCPGCGTSFKKENENASMISYTANCLDLHNPEQAS
jgi:hypothetical protein